MLAKTASHHGADRYTQRRLRRIPHMHLLARCSACFERRRSFACETRAKPRRRKRAEGRRARNESEREWESGRLEMERGAELGDHWTCWRRRRPRANPTSIWLAAKALRSPLALSFRRCRTGGRATAQSIPGVASVAAGALGSPLSATEHDVRHELLRSLGGHCRCFPSVSAVRAARTRGRSRACKGEVGQGGATDARARTPTSDDLRAWALQAMM